MSDPLLPYLLVCELEVESEAKSHLIDQLMFFGYFTKLFPSRVLVGGFTYRASNIDFATSVTQLKSPVRMEDLFMCVPTRSKS